MAKPTSNVNLISDTFQVLITKVNDLLTALRGEVVTANSTLANTTGNTFISGSFIANNIYVGNTVAGGTIFSNTSGLPEIQSANLSFTSNVAFIANTTLPSATFTNSTTTFSNTVVANKTLAVNGAVTFSNTLTVAGNSSVAGTLNVSGALTQNNNQVWHVGNLDPSGFATLANPSFSGSVTTPVLRISDNNYSFSLVSNVSTITFDTSDTIQYDRAANSLRFSIANTVLLSSNSSLLTANSAMNVVGALTQNNFQVWHAGNFDPGGFANSSTATYTTSVSSPLFNVTGLTNYNITNSGNNCVIRWNTNDTDQFDRTNSVRSFNIGSVQKLRINSAGVNANGSFDATGTISQNGSAVWHTGNFNPALYAPLASPTFTGTVTLPTTVYSGNVSITSGTLTTANVSVTGTLSTGNIVTTGTITSTGNTQASYLLARIGANSYVQIDAGDATNSGYVGFRNTAGVRLGYIGNQSNTTPLSIVSENGAGISISGGSIYLSNTTTITGNLVTTGQVNANVALSFGLGNYYLDWDSTNARINWDVSDYDRYDRTNNIRSFNIAGANIASVTATGMSVNGAFSAGRIACDSGFYSSFLSSNPLTNYDGYDYMIYDRTADQWIWRIAGSDKVYFNNNGITVIDNITKSGTGKFVYDGQNRTSTRITDGTAAPSGGSDGDIYFQYT